MNIVHVRDSAKAMFKAKVFNQRTLIALMKSPVFVYECRKESLTVEEHAWCAANILNERRTVPEKLPYKMFTLYRPRPDDGADGTQYLKQIEQRSGHVFTDETIYHVFSGGNNVFDPSGKPYRSLLTVARQDKIDGKSCWFLLHMNGEVKNGAVVSLWVDGKAIEVGEVQGDKSELTKEMIAATIETIMQFAFDTMSHFCVHLKVSPKHTDGKSVEWHMARTHYLVIGRKQAEQCRRECRGPSSGEIVRAAHWRRAHFKLLTSPRFTNKRGQRVPVKQAWVGPDEWTGLDGKIYKVMT